MKHIMMVGVALLAGLSLQAREAIAQDAPTRVTCESKDSARTACDMDTRGVVVIERQLSRTQCVEGQNWGLFKHSVWVSGGCRAVFALQGAPGQRPPSRDQYGNGDAASLPNRITCASEGGQRHECEMNTFGSVRLATQLSRTPCVEGQNWGLFKHSVWVSGGCRAVFVNEGDTAPEPSRGPTNRQIAACNDRHGGYGEVTSTTPLRPGAYEIILQYDDGRYVCNVDGRNVVSYFEALRR